jgi:hypothetical protein
MTSSIVVAVKGKAHPYGKTVEANTDSDSNI